MKGNILVVGTVAYDILFPIQGDIRHEIPLKNGKLRSVNMSFLARKSQYYYGGTAANIAYGLGLLGKKPYMFSAVGEDFKKEFKKHLERHGVICSPIFGPKGSETAKCFQISDELHQQITIFQANYYGDRLEDMPLTASFSRESLINMKYAIFSPGNNISTLNHVLEFRKFNEKALVIFDPGMNITSFSKEDITECASLCDILISNDVEILRIEKVHGLEIKDLLDIGITYVIETQGEKGSTIHSLQGKDHIPIVKPRKVVETTGAGDAYRAGMIAGLYDGKTIKEACQLGAKMGSLCVEEYGGQGYRIK
jgi:adenosine kinase